MFAAFLAIFWLIFVWLVAKLWVSWGGDADALSRTLLVPKHFIWTASKVGIA